MNPHRNFVHAGANRGGKAEALALVRHLGVRGSEIAVIDPEEGRAEALGDFYRAHGARAEGHQARGEVAVPRLNPEAEVLLTVDELAPMGTLIANRTGQVVWAQGVGRGGRVGTSPPPIFGLTLASFPERPEARREHASLFSTLAATSPPQSSRAIRDDALNALQLGNERAFTSEATAVRIASVERTRDDELLAQLFFARASYPLVVVERATRDHRVIREEALDIAGPRNERVAVALVTTGKPRVDFLAIEPARGTRLATVRMVVTYELPPPPPPRPAWRLASVEVRHALPEPIQVARPAFTD